MKSIFKGEYDHFKLNLTSLEPIKAIKFGDVLGDLNMPERPYNEILDDK